MKNSLAFTLSVFSFIALLSCGEEELIQDREREEELLKNVLEDSRPDTMFMNDVYGRLSSSIDWPFLRQLEEENRSIKVVMEEIFESADKIFVETTEEPDYYLKLQGIDGESAAATEQDLLAVFSLERSEARDEMLLQKAVTYVERLEDEGVQLFSRYLYEDGEDQPVDLEEANAPKVCFETLVNAFSTLSGENAWQEEGNRLDIYSPVLEEWVKGLTFKTNPSTEDPYDIWLEGMLKTSGRSDESDHELIRKRAFLTGYLTVISTVAAGRYDSDNQHTATGSVMQVFYKTVVACSVLELLERD